MLLVDAVPNPLQDVEVLKAVIGAIATITVAALSLYGVIRAAQRPSRTKPPVEGDTGKALQEFNGTQNEFMALVIADNTDLRGQLQQVKDMVEKIQEHQNQFIGAVRRYLMKLAHAWPGPGYMPPPDDEDFHILEDTLPSNPRKPLDKDRI